MKMNLTLNEIKQINSIVNKFYKDNEDNEKIQFTLESDNSNGIGSTLKLSFPVSYFGTLGTFTVDISGIENW